MKDVDWRIIICGIICITILEVTALLNGINGWKLTLAVGIIAAAIGVTLPQVKVK